MAGNPQPSKSGTAFEAHSPYAVPETEFDYRGAFKRGEITGTELGAFESGVRFGRLEAEIDMADHMDQKRAEFNSYAAAQAHTVIQELLDAMDAPGWMQKVSYGNGFGPTKWEFSSRMVAAIKAARQELE